MIVVEMTEEMKKARRDYMRSYMARYMKEWRRKNPTKAKDIQNRYWQKRADQGHVQTNSNDQI